MNEVTSPVSSRVSLTPQQLAANYAQMKGTTPVQSSPSSSWDAFDKAVGTIPPEKSPDDKSIFENISTDIKKRGEAISNDLETKNTEDNPIVSGFEAAAEGAKAVGDVATDIVKPGLEAAKSNADMLFGENPIYKALKGAIKGGIDLAGGAKDAVGNSEAVSDLGQRLNELVTKHPEASKVIEDTLKILGASGEISNTVLGAEGAAKGLSEVAPIIKSAPETAIEGASSVIDKTKDLLSKSPEKSLQESINNTMPIQNKENRIAELKSSLPGDNAGGVTRKGILGDVTPTPSARDIAIGTEVHPYIKGVKDPLVRIQNVNKGIVDTSSEVDNFLDTNKTNANLEDMRGYLETNKPTFSLKGDAGATESYERATENAINTIADTLKSSAKETGDFGPGVSGADIRKARIAVDTQINKQLGESVFGSPQYNGIKAAAVDSRNLINRMNEDLLRYPGQLEKVNRMNEFISEAKGRGIEVDMKKPEVKTELESRFGLKTTAEAEANAKKLETTHEKMNKLYEARDNMIDKFENQIGKNKLTAWIKANPIKAKAIGLGIGAAGVGHYYHLLP